MYHLPGILSLLLILRLVSTLIMQQASDCDKILVHDDDLLMIDGIGHDTVSTIVE